MHEFIHTYANMKIINGSYVILIISLREKFEKRRELFEKWRELFETMPQSV